MSRCLSMPGLSNHSWTWYATRCEVRQCHSCAQLTLTSCHVAQAKMLMKSLQLRRSAMARYFPPRLNANPENRNHIPYWMNSYKMFLRSHVAPYDDFSYETLWRLGKYRPFPCSQLLGYLMYETDLLIKDQTVILICKAIVLIKVRGIK